ncbi:MAG: hypothetical protein RLZZ584_1265 [Pseudomonadota bacterium]|jgi:hypothetical protein
MTRLWKSELRLDLRIGGCQAEMRGAGWQRRLLASASGAGTGAAAISAALSALQLVDDSALLPSDARLTVADEYVFYALLDAQVSAQQALEDATQQFIHALGREDLVVQVTPLPAGSGWLAAALLETHLHSWADALADAGIRLEHLHPALVQDLIELADHIREDDAVIALIRDQGVTLVRLEGGVPGALAWELFDPQDSGALDQRLQTFVHNTAPGPVPRMGQADTSGPPVAIYLYTPGKTLSLYSASLDDDKLGAHPGRRRIEEPSAFEQALASGNGLSVPGGRRRRGGGDDNDTVVDLQRRRRASAGRGHASRPTVDDSGRGQRARMQLIKGGQDAASGDLDHDDASDPYDTAPSRRRGVTTAGTAALTALATRLRQALQRSRARRLERKRIDAELAADSAFHHRDFSPTGSVLPDEWQDTVQSDETSQAEAATTSSHDAHDDEAHLLEMEDALELAFVREDELASVGWQPTRPQIDDVPAPAPPGERRRNPAAALIWAQPVPVPEAELPLAPRADEPPSVQAGRPELPTLADEAAELTDAELQRARRAYAGVERRRSHRA